VEGEDERIKLLAECMTQLAPQARRAMELRYQQAHKPAEIAKILGWTPNSIYVALSRARDVLKECVEAKLRAQPI
jgi:RNA polymerase sigma-70 factor (ECF subfamily)